VGHNNIFINKSTRCTRVAPTGSERVSGNGPARGEGKDLSMVMNRAPAPHRSNIMHCMHAHAPQTLYHRARMYPIPFQIMGWPWVSIYTSGAQVQG
jgi:hypothetical protein